MEDINRAYCEDLWAREKYKVLARSQEHFDKIREYVHSDSVNQEVLEDMIDQAKHIEENHTQVARTFKEIWSNFKDKATIEEKELFLDYLQKYKARKMGKKEVLIYLGDLLDKYPNPHIPQCAIYDRD